MSHTQYVHELNALVDVIFDALAEEDVGLPEIAKRTKLGHSTVWKLVHRHTTYPRMKTVMALARAAGLDVRLVTRAAAKRRTA